MNIATPGTRPPRTSSAASACMLARLCTALILPALASTAFAANPAAPPAPAAPAAPQPVSVGSMKIDEDVTEWRFVGRLSASAAYDDNITIRPEDELDDYVFHVAPSLAFGIGNFRTAVAPYAAIPHFIARTGEEDLPRRDYAFLSYTPDGVFFREHDGENAVNHDVRVAARKERELWNAHGEVRYQRVTDVDLDFGRRVRQSYYTAQAEVERALTGKILGDLGVRAYRAEYSGGFSSTDLRGTGFVDYQIAPKTTIGLGGAVGQLLAGRGADQTYQQPLVQIKYRPTGKTYFVVRAGEEFRQYDSDIDDRSRFVFSLDADYDATDATTFNLAARRETQTSAQYSGENIVATLYQAGIRQRFLQRIYVTLVGGQVRNEYEHNVPTASISRRDDFYFYKASASSDISRRGTIELSYEHRENDSTLSNFEFDQNLVTLGAAFLF